MNKIYTKKPFFNEAEKRSWLQCIYYIKNCQVLWNCKDREGHKVLNVTHYIQGVREGKHIPKSMNQAPKRYVLWFFKI